MALVRHGGDKKYLSGCPTASLHSSSNCKLVILYFLAFGRDHEGVYCLSRIGVVVHTKLGGRLVVMTDATAGSENDICKRLDLRPNMAKVNRALNLPTRFHEWRWLLKKYWEKAGGLPPAKYVERWKQYGPYSDDLPDEQEESSIENPLKRKADTKSSKDEAHPPNHRN
ncbi:unnamed protein product [Prunus armeniaca]